MVWIRYAELPDSASGRGRAPGLEGVRFVPHRGDLPRYGVAMPDPTVHLRRLVELGLNRYEAKAYLALLLRESFAAAELAAQAGIPRQRIYDVLGSLVQRGLAHDLPGRVTRYSATDPGTAIDGLIGAQRRELDELASQAEDLAASLRPTWTRGQDETAPLDYVEVLRDPAMLSTRLQELVQEATRELLTLAKPPYALEDDPAGLAATRRIAEAGGDVRCVYEPAILDDAALVEEALAFIDEGEGARVVDHVPMRLCLSDSSRVLCSLTDPVVGGLTSTTILIDHPALAASLRLSFETLWAAGEPFEQALERRGSVGQIA